MLKILLIALGGALGALLRYLISGWGQAFTEGPFPVGTLLVNLLGCLLFGTIIALLSGPWLGREEVRLAVLVGGLGAFTTFSTFAWETVSLASRGYWWWAALNLALSNALGLVAIWFGYRLGVKWFGV